MAEDELNEFLNVNSVISEDNISDDIIIEDIGDVPLYDQILNAEGKSSGQVYVRQAREAIQEAEAAGSVAEEKLVKAESGAAGDVFIALGIYVTLKNIECSTLNLQCGSCRSVAMTLHTTNKALTRIGPWLSYVGEQTSSSTCNAWYDTLLSSLLRTTQFSSFATFIITICRQSFTYPGYVNAGKVGSASMTGIDHFKSSFQVMNIDTGEGVRLKEAFRNILYYLTNLQRKNFLSFYVTYGVVADFPYFLRTVSSDSADLLFYYYRRQQPFYWFQQVYNEPQRW